MLSRSSIISHCKILDERVTHAVREVCDFKGKDNLANDYHMCAERAWAGAQPQIVRAYVQASRPANGR